MHIGPIPVRFIDLLDITIVAFLLYQLYQLIKGSFAIYIFYSVILFFLFWLIIRDNFLLLSTIFRQIIGVGVIALLIVFQPELRRLMTLIGTRFMSRFPSTLNEIFSNDIDNFNIANLPLNTITRVCHSLSEKKIGALIVLKRNSPLDDIINTGEEINAKVTEGLIESIFNKNSPLHDGAIVISGNRILAAKCILPISDKTDLPADFGLRHRAALGLSLETDAIIIVISEETGNISIAEFGNIQTINKKFLFTILKEKF